MSEKQGRSAGLDVEFVLFLLLLAIISVSMTVGIVANNYFEHQEKLARIQAGQEVKDGR